MKAQAYLSFEGRCEEALAFYEKAIDAKVLVKMHFDQSPEACPEGMLPPGSEKKVMHSAFLIGETEIMATDGNCGGKSSFAGISLAISTASDSDTEKYFNALAVGGLVTMPLNKTFFASSFGTVQDKFGVHWMVLTPTPMHG